MIDPDSQIRLKTQVIDCTMTDRLLLDQLRSEIAPLRSEVRRIQARTSTAISLVGTDGGNSRIPFDPFLIQLVRVVDSSNNEYCLRAITPTTNLDSLSLQQFDGTSAPATPLGELMAYLNVKHLTELSHMIRSDGTSPTSPSWVQLYRELVDRYRL